MEGEGLSDCLKVWTSHMRRTVQTAGNINCARLEHWKALDELDAVRNPFSFDLLFDFLHLFGSSSHSSSCLIHILLPIRFPLDLPLSSILCIRYLFLFPYSATHLFISTPF